jgi:hypothetical protein
VRGVGRFILDHHHAPEECRAVYAAWSGFDSPLRQHGALASCASGGHRLFWTVEAGDEPAALSQLPPFIAERTEISEVSEVTIP